MFLTHLQGDDDGLGAPVNTKHANKNKQKVQMKVVRQSFAVGGLDQDYVDWGMGAAGSATTQVSIFFY